MQNDGSRPWVDQYGREFKRYPQQPQKEEDSSYPRQTWPHRGLLYTPPLTEQSVYEEPRAQGNIFSGYIQRTHGTSTSSYPPPQDYGGPSASDRYPEPKSKHQSTMASTGKVDWLDAIPPMDIIANRGQALPPIAEQERWAVTTPSSLPPAAVPRSQYADTAMLVSTSRGVGSQSGSTLEQRQVSHGQIPLKPGLTERPFRKASIRDLIDPVPEETSKSSMTPQATRAYTSTDDYNASISFLRRSSAPTEFEATAGSAKQMQYAADVSTSPAVFHVTGSDSHYSYSYATTPGAHAAVHMHGPDHTHAIEYSPPTPLQLPPQNYRYDAPRSSFPSQVPAYGPTVAFTHGQRESAAAAQQLKLEASSSPDSSAGSTIASQQRYSVSPSSNHQPLQERVGAYYVRDTCTGEVSEIERQEPILPLSYSGPLIHGIQTSEPNTPDTIVQPQSTNIPGMFVIKFKSQEARRRRGVPRTPVPSRSMPNLQLIPLEMGTQQDPIMVPNCVERQGQDVRTEYPNSHEPVSNRAVEIAAPLARDLDVVMKEFQPRSFGSPVMQDSRSSTTNVGIVSRDVEMMSIREADSWRLQLPQEVPRRSKSVEILSSRNPLPPPLPAMELLKKGKGRECATQDPLMARFSAAELETSRILTEMSAGFLRDVHPTYEDSTSRSSIPSVSDQDRTVSVPPSPKSHIYRNPFVLIDCAKSLKRYSRSLFTVANGPLIQNNITEFVDNMMFHATEMLRIESRFTHEAMQEWIAKNHAMEEYTIIQKMTQYLRHVLEDDQDTYEEFAISRRLRKLFHDYIYNGRLGKWLQDMERELLSISEEQARGNLDVQDAQRRRAAEHRAKNFRLPGEAAGNFFGPGLA